jgi:hypothetical protein
MPWRQVRLGEESKDHPLQIAGVLGRGIVPSVVHQVSNEDDAPPSPILVTSEESRHGSEVQLAGQEEVVE